MASGGPQRRPGRRRLLAPTVVLVAAVAAAVVVAGLPAGSGPSPREQLESLTASDPAFPVALPVRVPTGYELRGGIVHTTDGGTTTRASFRFFPRSGAEPGRPAIEVCVVTARSAAGGCLASNHDPLAVREVEHLVAVIVPLGPGPDAVTGSAWVDVELTTAWEQLDWLAGAAD